MPKKRKGVVGARKNKKLRYHGPQDEGPHHIDSPNTMQPSPSTLHVDVAETSTVIPHSNQELKATDPTFDALRRAQQSSIAADSIASASTTLLHSACTQDHSGTRYYLGPKPPSLCPQLDIARATSVETNSRSAQNNGPGGNFTNAHDFTIGSAVFYNTDRSEVDRRAGEERKARKERRAQEKQKAKVSERAEREKRTREEREAEEKMQEEKALERLAAKGMPSAMLYSKDRGYVPRCNADTRRALRGRVIKWGREVAEMRRLLWLSGFAGVGKSAVAQTVAEELKQEGLLGGVFFFSRPNDRSDPDVVIPTLVYQLALLLPEYRRIISQQLIKDPLILNQNRHCQFKELIINPFLALTAQISSISQRPLLIVLDGLDECSDREAQCEFVEMISHHTHKEGAALRLRWLVCSRPEPDLKIAFSTAECDAICLRAKLEVDDSEAQKDARRILAKGFADIRRKYPDQVTSDWPAEDQVHFIADRASGHLGFASFIIRFIGDKYYDDPSGQLSICLQFLGCTGSSTDVNPLHPLDLLYTQILSDVPKNILPTTQRILAFAVSFGHEFPSAVFLANCLGLSQASFYRSLQRLHSVLVIPPASEAAAKPIRTYHASFSDFLKDPVRSGKFCLDVPYLDIAVSCLKWLGYGHKDPSKRVEPELTWIPSETSRQTTLDSLCRFSFTPCWKASISVPENSMVALFEVLEKFDFNLDYIEWWRHETKDFAYFIRWLVTLGHYLVAVGDSHGTNLVIWHRDDPRAFTAAFSEDMKFCGPDTISLRLGIRKPIQVQLDVSQKYEPFFHDYIPR